VIACAFGLAALLLAVFTFVSMRSRPQPQPVAQMTVILPEKSRVLSLAVSPNGHFIAMVLVKDGQQQIWVRALDSLELLPLAGTIGAADPFWSPDNHSIAFFADARLKKIDRSGGPVQTLCDALGALGGTWNGNGEILIGGLSRLQRVSSAGGTASDLSDHPDVTEVDPFFLPDGEHFLTTRAANAASTGAGVWLGSMHGPDVKKILPDISKAEFMGPPPGSHIGAVVFTRAGTLMALPFDLKLLEPAGDTFPIAQGIPTNVSADLLAATSNAGVLAYVSGQQRGWQYVWRDYQGRNLGAYPDAGAVAMISPDGKQLAGDRNSDIWVSELTHGVATRLTFGPRPNMNPIWSPDGRYIAYDKIGVGIYRKPANGAGEEELLLPSKILAVPKSWSRDGKFIAYAQIDAGGADLMAIPIEGDRRPFPVVQTAANEDQGQFSPDGHWFAYTSNESGQSEIYVVPFPPAPNGGRWMVSRDGGVMPRWRRDGRELFYISPNSEMMSVEVNSQSVFQSGTPHSLFLTDMIDTGIRTGPMSWDIAPDGKRFLIISENSAGTSSLNVILNWRPEQQPR
jgi:Tol biopolymer transport system component